MWQDDAPYNLLVCNFWAMLHGKPEFYLAVIADCSQSVDLFSFQMF